MHKLLEREFEIVVVGAGPAGLAAAAVASESGVPVALLDDNPETGGQIWRSDTTGPHAETLARMRRLEACGAAIFRQARVFHAEPGLLFAETPEHVLRFKCAKLILATGARERFLPFPGWTLPNVTGAGGLQALVKCGLPVARRRVVVAGSGPLLLAVAAYLRQHGAEVPLICEQTSWRSLARFSLALATHPAKIAQALQLRHALRGIPFVPNSWPVRAMGDGRLETVEISRVGKTETIACDYLACGFHLVPNTELAALLGCELQNGFVCIDEFQQTSAPDILCAGEPAGIGGLELALIEGEIAGLVAARRQGAAVNLFGRRRKLQKFARAMDRAFRLRPELARLANADTIVCRCEDVTYALLEQHSSWRAAKLHTRCGMGPCQGRICGPATQFLFGWQPDSVRPPIFPVDLESLATISLLQR